MAELLVTDRSEQKRHFKNVKECYRDDSGNLLVEYEAQEPLEGRIKREKVIDGRVEKFSTKFIVSEK